ncbi:hypothetical protein EDF63_3455 [Curtobacterium sp. JUb34]|uniref:hypothetical protein n=1 Tax=Curtobacterium sp. JUb34 TaxID=2485109 RepID=UPI000FC28B46|nr:hypothetical protein [Curtobacterium sp. JUb34]ROR28863.1 hypothetical protein EDF63_3455 [Curtobacterium sp. JUb34]
MSATNRQAHLLLDWDGVINVEGNERPGLLEAVVTDRHGEDVLLRWHPAVVDELREILSRSRVRAFWLTTNNHLVPDHWGDVVGLPGIENAAALPDGHGYPPRSPLSWTTWRAAAALRHVEDSGNVMWIDAHIDETLTAGISEMGRTSGLRRIIPDSSVGLSMAHIAEIQCWVAEISGENPHGSRGMFSSDWEAAVTAAQAREIRESAARDVEAEVAETRAEYRRICLSTDEVAAVLHLSPTAISAALADGALYCERIGSEDVFPTWQFAEGRTIAGLPAVLRARPEGLRGPTLHGWMTTAKPTLRLAAEIVSPREWLRRGHDVRTITGLLSTFGYR